MQWVEEKVKSILAPFVDSDIELAIWQGECTLRNVQLRVEALDELKLDLPCKVLGAFIGKLHVSLSWRTLVSVTVDRMYVKAGGLSDLADESGDTEEERAEKQRKVKRAVIDAWQVMQDNFKPPGALGQRATVVDRLASWLISRIRLDIRNVHLRLEEALSELSTPAAGVAEDVRAAVEPRLVLGVVLRGLSLNELGPDKVVRGRLRREAPKDGNEDALGAAAVGLRVDVSGLAVYTRVEDAPPDAEAHPGSSSSSRGALARRSSVEEAMAGAIVAGAVKGTDPVADESSRAAHWVAHMQPMVDAGPTDAHILRPSSLRVCVRAQLRGILKGSQLAAEISLCEEDGLRIGARHTQLLSLLALGEALSLKARRHAHKECRRPTSPPSSSPREWWHYVGRCGLLTQRNARLGAEANRLSWVTFRRRRKQRVEFVNAFVDAAPSLKKKVKAGQSPPEAVAALFELEEALELPSIFTYRALAAQVFYQRSGWKKRLASMAGVSKAPERVEEAELQAALHALEEGANEQAKAAASKDFVQVGFRCPPFMLAPPSLGLTTFGGATRPSSPHIPAPYPRATSPRHISARLRAWQLGTYIC